jgi:CBS domain-containing protein
MTCKDIMTPNPSCCVPGDSVAIAAQIMRRNDVGPVLVVSDQRDNRLVGIVTDRDLALKVIAEGRDPHTTRVDEVMSLNPVCCREDDSTEQALRLMSQNQVRRIPIVDEGNRLRGIVAQADLARNVDEEDIGRTVEQISEPYPSYARPGFGQERQHRGRNMASGPMALGTLCMGIGAGLMYLFDPLGGSGRRRRVRSRTSSMSHSSAEAVESKSRHLRNRAAGILAIAKSRWNATDEVTDEKLVARIRSRLGRHASYARAVQVTSNGGNVILSGPILAKEVSGVLDCVNAIPGVKSVESRLEVHETANSLQGGRNLHDYDGAKAGWSPATRLIAGIAGGGLLWYGLRSRMSRENPAHASDMARLSRGSETPGY